MCSFSDSSSLESSRSRLSWSDCLSPELRVFRNSNESPLRRVELAEAPSWSEVAGVPAVGAGVIVLEGVFSGLASGKDIAGFTMYGEAKDQTQRLPAQSMVTLCSCRQSAQLHRHVLPLSNGLTSGESGTLTVQEDDLELSPLAWLGEAFRLELCGAE